MENFIVEMIFSGESYCHWFEMPGHKPKRCPEKIFLVCFNLIGMQGGKFHNQT